MKSNYSICFLLLFSATEHGFCQTTLKNLDSDTVVTKLSDSKSDLDIPYTYFILGSDTPSIQFVGSGEVQKAITEGSELPVNTGLGVIYRKEFNPDSLREKIYRFGRNKASIEKGTKIYKPSFLRPLLFELEAIINIASNTDTLSVDRVNGNIINRSAFGSGINTPINSRQSAKLTARIYCKDYIHILDGYEAGLYISNRSWLINDSTNIGAGVLNFKLGFFADVIPNKFLENNSIRLGIVPLGFKFLIGDIAQSTNNIYRNEIIGSENIFFWSPELNLTIQLQNIEANFSLPITYTYGSDVPGLSGVQFITSISFTGGFGLKLND